MAPEKDHLQKALTTAFDEFITVFFSVDENSIWPGASLPAKAAA